MEQFFYPRSIAIIGVSDSPTNMGKRTIQNLKNLGFEGSINAVGKKKGMIEGCPLFSDVLDIVTEVDLALILIGADYVPDTLEQCGKKGIKRVIICTVGFSEFGASGEALDHRILEHREQLARMLDY